MKYSKVVYVCYLPLSEKIFHDFYIGDLVEEGFIVEYLDITKLFFPDLIVEKFIGFNCVIEASSYQEIDKYLSKQNGNTLFISLMTYEGRVVELYKLLTKHNCQLAFFARGVFPLISYEESSIHSKNKIQRYYSKIQNILKKLLIVFIKKDGVKILIKNFEKWKIDRSRNEIYTNSVKLKENGEIKSYNYVFKAGDEGIRSIGNGYYVDQERAKIIDVNSFDFDNYLVKRTGESLITEPYCVFLDEYMPYHPDFEMFNISTINDISYYRELNSFFSYIEKARKLKVIIAAHPKALKYSEMNPFDGRTIFFKKSCELVRNAEFAISHCSTSVNFPILFNKPIVFIVSSSMESIMPYYFSLTKHLAKLLGSQFLYFDARDYERVTLSLNAGLYDEYVKKFITSISNEKKLTKDIFINFLKTIK